LFDQVVEFDDFLGMFHGNNERVSLESLSLTAAVIARTIEGLRDSESV
jgi:acetylornithine deacetylase/succinyl-diaminopimelate desuccinylase-like protein